MILTRPGVPMGRPQYRGIKPCHMAHRAGPERPIRRRKRSRKTWSTLVGGMAVLLSLLFTWENLQVTQDNLRITQEAATRSQDLTRQGQITERFTRAIDQLGSDKDEVRLGGIYALGRIARDSPPDHWPIMEILTAYVRKRAPRTVAYSCKRPWRGGWRRRDGAQGRGPSGLS